MAELFMYLMLIIKEKEYQVSNTEEEGTLFTIKENEIFMKIV